MPEAMDRLDRRLIQLKIERVALKKESDDASKQRLADLEQAIVVAEKEYADFTEIWKAEKATLQGNTDTKESLERLRRELETARRAGDLTRMSEIQYGRIPELEKRLKEESSIDQSKMTLLRNKVGEEEVAEIVAKWTGIPVAKMLEGERDKLLRMEQVLAERVVGQDEGVTAVSNAIRRSRAGLSDPSKPVGSFLFLGPTGVGKTELCKTLASFLFDTEEAMVRIDMSEFMEKHSVARLVGAPPGYVGYEEGGYLTEAVRRKPYSVILLDEIEKAHPDVFNILLQVLDDGRLTDGQGRTVDFRNTVIVMTSNIGSQLIQEHVHADYETIKTLVMGVVQQHFKPEFINRVDESVVFHALGRSQISAIAVRQMQLLVNRLQDRKMTLSWTDEGLDHLAEAGFDPVYGARPLKRVIQNQVENPLAQAILSGQFRAGDEIRMTVESGKLIFQKAVAKQVA
jgi:ATP-dependent Clp protease ATP-binding subunit ClpB